MNPVDHPHGGGEGRGKGHHHRVHGAFQQRVTRQEEVRDQVINSL